MRINEDNPTSMRQEQLLPRSKSKIGWTCPITLDLLILLRAESTCNAQRTDKELLPNLAPYWSKEEDLIFWYLNLKVSDRLKVIKNSKDIWWDRGLA